MDERKAFEAKQAEEKKALAGSTCSTDGSNNKSSPLLGKRSLKNPLPKRNKFNAPKNANDESYGSQGTSG